MMPLLIALLAWPPGAAFEVERQQATVGGLGDTRVVTAVSETWQVRVLEVAPDGTTRLQRRRVGGRHTTLEPDGPVEIGHGDARADGPLPAPGRMWLALHDTRLVYRLDAAGEVQAIEAPDGLDDLRARHAALAPADPTAGGPDDIDAEIARLLDPQLAHGLFPRPAPEGPGAWDEVQRAPSLMKATRTQTLRVEADTGAAGTGLRATGTAALEGSLALAFLVDLDVFEVETTWQLDPAQQPRRHQSVMHIRGTLRTPPGMRDADRPARRPMGFDLHTAEAWRRVE